METITAKKTKTIKEKLLSIIDEFDEQRIFYLYQLLKPKEEVEEEDTSAYWTEEFIAELNMRWEDYKKGKKSYSEEEMNMRTDAFLKTLRVKK
jgi:hypothetical protein